MVVPLRQGYGGHPSLFGGGRSKHFVEGKKWLATRSSGFQSEGWWNRGELNSRPLECHAYYLRHYSLNLPTKPYHFKAPQPTWLAVLGGCLHQSTDSRRYSDQTLLHCRSTKNGLARLREMQKVRSNCLDIKPFFFTVRVLSESFFLQRRVSKPWT